MFNEQIYYFDIEGTKHFIVNHNIINVTRVDDNTAIIVGLRDRMDHKSWFTAHIMRYDDAWRLHHDSEPAFINYDERCLFFHSGYNFKVEDLPCDDMQKTLLTLRYTPEFSNPYYYWYL